MVIDLHTGMIDKSAVERAVGEWLDGKEYFLVAVDVTADDRIVVEIDHHDGVWIEDCAELSRYIESQLDREAEDYELEVGSAGLGQPFRVVRQYEIHEGEEVEVVTLEGRKLQGTLCDVTPETFTLLTREKRREEGEKRPKMIDVKTTYRYSDVKETRYLIRMK